MSIAEAPVPSFDVSNSSVTDAASDQLSATVLPFPELTIDLRSCQQVTITDLVRQEAELAYADWIGELHPAHAARLREVSAELDRRWKNFS